MKIARMIYLDTISPRILRPRAKWTELGTRIPVTWQPKGMFKLTILSQHLNSDFKLYHCDLLRFSAIRCDFLSHKFRGCCGDKTTIKSLLTSPHISREKIDGVHRHLFGYWVPYGRASTRNVNKFTMIRSKGESKLPSIHFE